MRAGVAPLARAGARGRARARADLARPDDRARLAGSPSARCSRSSPSALVDRRDAPGDAFQVLGIVLVENGLALAALELPGGASLAIELGVALDLMLIALVAGVFHERIFAEFGAGDTAALRSLRD